MTGRPLTAFPAALLGLTAVVEVAAVALSWGLEPRYDTLLYAVYSVTLTGAGALIASRRPENVIGWLFCGFGLLNAVSADLAQGYGLRAAEQGWAGGEAAEWIATTSWLPGAIGTTLTFLLFPDGRIPGRAWRWVPWAAIIGPVLATPGWSLSTASDSAFVSGHNPVAVDSPAIDALLAIGLAVVVVALIASVVALVMRFRASRGIERQQIKWFAFAAAIAGVVLSVAPVLWDVTPVVRVLAALVLTALPIAACIAILRHRLYDIDVVVNRTLVYGALTVMLAAVFALATLVLGTALGGGSTVATAGATLAVAAAFRPLRDEVQDAVDRRFNRARYDAMRRMTDFLEALRAGRAEPEDVEPLLRDVTDDPALELLFFLPERAVYVDARGVAAGLPSDGREHIPIERAEHPLAMVLCSATDPARRALLRTVVEAGGLAIEIARLRVRLRHQLEEVTASRARIVEAANAERRRIERDLHDGAQQRLVSIGLALRHAQHELGDSAARGAGRTLDEAVAEVAVAIEELRELARGLPPSQLDAGLEPAFRELARRSPTPVELDVAGERFDPGVEAAAYFIGCEGVTNAVKHARATRIALTTAPRDGNLVVSIADDGIGGAAPLPGSGLTGLTDRVAALGGTLRIHSDPGAGTTLTAELPCGS